MIQLKKMVKRKIFRMMSQLCGSSFKRCTGIRGVEIVSLDVFDTLIFRDVDNPEDIFEKVFPEDKSFKEKRCWAERQARKKNDIEEVTLTDIYACLQDVYGEKKAEELMDREVEAEIAHTYANPQGLSFFHYLLKKKKRVVITSDMYLPGTVIEQILQKEGFSGYEKVFVSGDCGVNKRSGRLYKKLIDEMGTNNIVHIGDHIVSDYIQAIRSGINASLYNGK